MWHQGKRTCDDDEEDEEMIKDCFIKMLEQKEKETEFMKMPQSFEACILVVMRRSIQLLAQHSRITIIYI